MSAARLRRGTTQGEIEAQGSGAGFAYAEPGAGLTATSSVALAASDNLVGAAAGLRLYGYAVANAGAPGPVARINVRHGTLDAHPLLFPIFLDPSQSTSEMFRQTVLVPNGLRIQVVAGTVDVVLFTAVVAP